MKCQTIERNMSLNSYSSLWQKHFDKAKKKKVHVSRNMPKWKFRVDRHQPFFFFLPFFSPRSQKPHQIKKMLTFRTFLFRNCLQNSYIFIFVLESPHQMKKFLTFRTILFQNCLQISQFFIFVLKSRKKRLGSGGFGDWGRVTGNMNLFFFLPNVSL